MSERTAQQSHQVYKLQIARLMDELLEQVRVHGTNEAVNWATLETWPMSRTSWPMRWRCRKEMRTPRHNGAKI